MFQKTLIETKQRIHDFHYMGQLKRKAFCSNVLTDACERYVDVKVDTMNRYLVDICWSDKGHNESILRHLFAECKWSNRGNDFEIGVIAYLRVTLKI